MVDVDQDGIIDYRFPKEIFGTIYGLDDETATTLLMISATYGDSEGENSSLIVLDGVIQGLNGLTESVLMFYNSDPKCYEKAKEATGIELTLMGAYIDCIHRATDGLNYFTLMLGQKIEDEMFIVRYPFVMSMEQRICRRTSIEPVRLMHLKCIDKKDGVYNGIWAIVDKNFDNADEVIDNFKHDNEVVDKGGGGVSLKGDEYTVEIYGSIELNEAALPASNKMTSKESFVALLYTMKVNSMMNLGMYDPNGEGISQIRNSQREMEEIYEKAINKVQTFMLRNKKAFTGMADPFKSFIGQGMGYTGMMYSRRFLIVQLICRDLEYILDQFRQALQDVTESISLEGYSVCEWNSKKLASIFTKITDYAKEVQGKAEPNILDACGLDGIKDYVRTRLIVPNDGSPEKCVEDYINKMNETTEGALQAVIHKDKSSRFKPDGRAIYTTGSLILPANRVMKRMNECLAEKGLGDKYPFLVQGFSEDGSKEKATFAVPFEIQVVNQAALDFINKNHGAYELLRVCQRISAVCECSKQSGGKAPHQNECAHCLYRSSTGMGVCPFCHICWMSRKQQKDCDLGCCEPREGSGGFKKITDVIEGMSKEELAAIISKSTASGNAAAAIKALGR